MTTILNRLIFTITLTWMLVPTGSALADQPSWSKGTAIKKIGTTLSVICEGSGPSKDLARRFALDSCRSTAANQINGDFKVQSLSLETEKSVNFHSEVSSEKSVTGLACDVKDEYGEEIISQHTVWIKCNYDLAKANVTSVTNKPEVIQERTDTGIIINTDLSSPTKSNAFVERKSLQQSETRSISLTVVPRCESVIIRGNRPRSERCDEMPVSLVLAPEDVEIIIVPRVTSRSTSNLTNAVLLAELTKRMRWYLRKINSLVLLLTVGLVCSCTTTGYRNLPLTKLNEQKTGTDKSNGFVEEAIPIQTFNLFHESVSSKIMSELKSNQNRHQALRNVQAFICDGRKPRVPAKFKIHLVPPKSDAGIPVDQASAAKTRFLKLARQYVQNRFLDDASDVELTNKETNISFENYQNCIVGPDSDRKCGRFEARVITVPHFNKAKLEDHYKTLRYTPKFRSFGHAETIYAWREQFLAIVFPKDHLAVLAPKMATIHQAKFADDGSTFLTSQSINADNDEVVFQRSPNFSRHVHFVPSPNGFEISGKNAYPLMNAVMRDLAILKSNFTFVLPKDVIPKLMDLNVNGEVPGIEFQYFGISPATDKFSPDYAIKHADYIWTQYLKRQIDIAEAVQPDGTISYSLSLDLALFCSYGTATSDLISK